MDVDDVDRPNIRDVSAGTQDPHISAEKSIANQIIYDPQISRSMLLQLIKFRSIRDPV